MKRQKKVDLAIVIPYTDKYERASMLIRKMFGSPDGHGVYFGDKSGKNAEEDFSYRVSEKVAKRIKKTGKQLFGPKAKIYIESDED